MNLIPSQLGAEPKKLAVLGGLALVLIVVYFINRTPDVPQQAASITAPAARNPVPLESLGARARSTATTASALTPGAIQGASQGSATTRRGEAAIQDFKPTLKLPDGVDVSRIDPALKLDLLAKLQQLPLEGGERSLFEFGAPPKPATPTPVVAPVKPITPPPSTPAAPATPPKPVIPPIPLKFYGYVSDSRNVQPGAAKRAFFLDGEDIVVAGENDVIRNRFKVIRIGVNSAVVEDTTNKNQQTLPLVEELPG